MPARGEERVRTRAGGWWGGGGGGGIQAIESLMKTSPCLFAVKSAKRFRQRSEKQPSMRTTVDGVNKERRRARGDAVSFEEPAQIWGPALQSKQQRARWQTPGASDAAQARHRGSA